MIYYINFLILMIAIYPKLNIIQVKGSSTGIRIDDILLLIYFIFIFFTTLKNGFLTIKSKEIKNVCKLFAVYIGCCLISSVYGILKGYVAPLISILYLIRKIEYFLLIFIGYRYMRKIRKVDKFMYLLYFIIIFHLFFSILQMLGLVGSFNAGVKLDYLTQYRITSTFNGSYELSAFMIIILPFILDNIMKKKNIVLNVIMITIILFEIYVSQSRTSLVLSLGIIGLMFLKENNSTYKILYQKIALISLGVLLVASILLSGKLNLDRFSSLNFNGVIEVFKYTWNYKSFENYQKNGSWYGTSPYDESNLANVKKLGLDDSLFMRVSHWMQMIDGFLKTPLIGLGIGISGAAADGNYVRIICESGILGFLIWLILLINIYMSINKKTDSLSIITKYAFISIILGSTVIDLFEASKVMMFFWFMLGMTYAQINMRGKNE